MKISKFLTIVNCIIAISLVDFDSTKILNAELLVLNEQVEELVKLFSNE